MKKIKTLVYVLILLFLALFALIFFGNFWKNTTGGTLVRAQNPSSHPSVSISLAPGFGEVKPGEDLIVIVRIIDMDLVEAEDIIIKYVIYDKNREEEISENSETVAIHTSISVVRHIYIPLGLSSGNYIIDVEVKYDEKKAVASSSFIVTGKYQISEKQIMIIFLSVLLVVLIIITIILYRLTKKLKHRK